LARITKIPTLGNYSGTLTLIY